MKSVLVCAFLCGSILFVFGQERQRENKGAAAQSAGDQIEVKADRFSGVTTLALKPQLIVDKPDHQLTIEIMTKLGEKKYFDYEADEIRSMIYFRSQSKEAIDFGDREIHFLLDGKPLNLGQASGGPDLYDAPGGLKSGFKISYTYASGFERKDLELLAKTNRAEMRIGAIELTLSAQTLALMRQYATQVLSQHNAIRRKPR